MAVYFARKDKDGPIKIGYSSAIEFRMRSNRWRLLAQIPGMDKTERYIHEKFARLRITGEWFRPASELMEFIAKPEVPEFHEKEKRTRTLTLTIRLNEEEYRRLVEMAGEATEMMGMSTWARMTLLKAARYEKNRAKERRQTTGDQPADTAH